MYTSVRFRRTVGVGPAWLPERFKARRYEVKDEDHGHLIVTLETLAGMCGGGRSTDFQQCLTMATKLALASDPRWVSYPSLSVVDEETAELEGPQEREINP